MKNNLIFGALLALFTFALGACTKIEGPGGAATIKGSFTIEEYDGIGNLITTYAAQKFDVFIMYGDDETQTYFDDDIETSYDGSFEFQFLEPGNYRIFFYEDHTFLEILDDPNLGNLDKAVFIDVEITDKRGTVDIGNQIVYERF